MSKHVIRRQGYDMPHPRAPHTSVIIALYREGTPRKEIARQLNLPPTTITNTLYRASRRGEISPRRKERPWLIRYLIAARIGVCSPRIFLSGLDRATVEKFLHAAPDGASANRLLRELIRAHYNP